MKNKMKNYIRFIAWLCLSLLVFVPSDAFAQGSVTVIKDPKVDKVLEYMYRQMVPLREKLWGFRLQLLTTNSREQANTMKSDFIGQYPQVRSYVTYSAPTFKLRVGDFRTREEASEFMVEIRKRFPGAFIVEDLVEIRNE
jgi:hypothetical protein